VERWQGRYWRTVNESSVHESFYYSGRYYTTSSLDGFIFQLAGSNDAPNCTAGQANVLKDVIRSARCAGTTRERRCRCALRGKQHQRDENSKPLERHHLKYKLLEHLWKRTARIKYTPLGKFVGWIGGQLLLKEIRGVGEHTIGLGIQVEKTSVLLSPVFILKSYRNTEVNGCV